MPILRGNTQGGVQPHKNTHVSGGSDAFVSSDVVEAVVKRIQTTSGPTNLDVGVVADGQYLQRSGTSIVGSSGTSSTPIEVKIVRYQLVY